MSSPVLRRVLSRYLLRFWMGVLFLFLLLAVVPLVVTVTTITSAVSNNLEFFLGDATAGTPDVADVVSTALDSLTSPWFPLVLLLFGGCVWILLELDGSSAFRPTVTEETTVTDRVRRLAQQADVSTPDVYVVDSGVENSFTVGRTGNATIYVTSALRDRLPADELDAVLAHELAHVKNRDVTVTTLANGAVYFGSMLWGIAAWYVVGIVGFAVVLWAVFALLGVVGSVLAPVVPLSSIAQLVPQIPGLSIAVHVGALAVVGIASALMLLFVLAALLLVALLPFVFPLARVARRFTRTREYAADAAAAEIVGSPAPLASALQRLSTTRRRPGGDLRDAWEQIQPFCVVSPRGDRDDRGNADRDDPESAPPGSLIGETHPPVEDRIERLQALAE